MSAKPFALNRAAISSETAVRTTGLLVAVLLVFPAAFAAKSSKTHNDAFLNGGGDEGRLASQVRHQLLMLPYYGVFDDLAFRLDGTTVTLLGAVTQPVLKDDAERAVKRIEGASKVMN
jgi:hyperosmotically inducible protein